MKKTKTIPHFKSREEEALFWDTHDTTDYLDQLKEVKNISFPKPRKKLVSVRMDDVMINRLKIIASRKGIGHLTLIRMWIAEKLSREHKTLARG